MKFLILAIGIASTAHAQSVAAAGQAPAKPGRFGFSLECVGGCTWVEPSIDHSHFRFKGSPKVSEVAARSAARRAGMKVGDIVTDVNGFSVTSEDAGLLLASDTIQNMKLRVERSGKPRDMLLYAVPECRGARVVVVGNHTGEVIEVLMQANLGADKTRMIGRAAPGTSELPITLNDSAYRATARYIYGRFAFHNSERRQEVRRLLELNTYRIVCRDD